MYSRFATQNARTVARHFHLLRRTTILYDRFTFLLWRLKTFKHNLKKKKKKKIKRKMPYVSEALYCIIQFLCRLFLFFLLIRLQSLLATCTNQMCSDRSEKTSKTWESGKKGEIHFPTATDKENIKGAACVHLEEHLRLYTYIYTVAMS